MNNIHENQGVQNLHAAKHPSLSHIVDDSSIVGLIFVCVPTSDVDFRRGLFSKCFAPFLPGFESTEVRTGLCIVEFIIYGELQ
ncbi:1896_t:CDS:2 [Racocetra fulgida]|uniref:1896_t:CDS:1 n=1 Tax=Racocetra fulgida TaxID=60492 RepID=A0A9N8ZIJ5_9GLOM|nr:1896_t:CDS:2 [Racocetra fulgida]